MWKKTGHLIDTHPDSWDERFLRCLVGRLKGNGGEKGGGSGVPWVGRAERCRRYHVHDGWAPGCEGCGERDGWVEVEDSVNGG